MGKTAKGRPAGTGAQDLKMHSLGVGNKKTKEQMRFEQATKEAVQTLARLGMPPEELAGSIRRCLNNMHGPEWHCVAGKVKAFSVHVRYWRGKSFLFEAEGLRIIVFQSAPPSPDDPQSSPQAHEQDAEGKQGPTAKGAERTSIKVLRSEMEQGYQRRVLAMASASARGHGKTGDLNSIVAALKASLTEFSGPVWHVMATRGAGDWGFSVAREEGQLLDFKLNGGDRILCWKHAQAAPGLTDMLTMKRISTFLFVATMLLLCVHVKLQGSCDRCCSSYPGAREKAGCAMAPTTSGGGAGAGDIVVEGCDVDVTEAADLCLRNAKIALFVTCGTMAGATALKWADRSKAKRQFKHQGA